MGTRHEIKIIIDDKVKVMQYGQWDGYPDGQGKRLAEFIHSEMDLPRLKDAVRECRFMTQPECEAFDKTHKDKPWPETHPWLSRDAGMKILSYIQNGSARDLVESDPEENKQWCEFFYTIDLDKETITLSNGESKIKPVPFDQWTVAKMAKLQKKFCG